MIAYFLVFTSYGLLIWSGLSVSHEHWNIYLASRFPDLVPGPCPIVLITDVSLFPNCKMNFTQFVKLITPMAGHGLTKEAEFWFIFKMLDSDRNGYLQWPEMKGIKTSNRLMTVLDWWKTNEERRRASVPMSTSFKLNYFAI
jgi:hypothetical protein